MKATALNFLIIGILSYYLIKGILFLFMWQTLVKMEEKGLSQKAAKRKAAAEKKRLETRST
jgi:5-bromo-4-chloroindolyl phosphate hydrolysis protein